MENFRQAVGNVKVQMTYIYYKADEQTRKCTMASLSLEFVRVGAPLSLCVLLMDSVYFVKIYFWSKIDGYILNELFTFSKAGLSLVIGVLTGQCPTGAKVQAVRLRILPDESGKSYLEKYEVKTRSRLKHFRVHTFKHPAELVAI